MFGDAAVVAQAQVADAAAVGQGEVAADEVVGHLVAVGAGAQGHAAAGAAQAAVLGDHVMVDADVVVIRIHADGRCPAS